MVPYGKLKKYLPICLFCKPADYQGGYAVTEICRYF